MVITTAAPPLYKLRLYAEVRASPANADLLTELRTDSGSYFSQIPSPETRFSVLVNVDGSYDKRHV